VAVERECANWGEAVVASERIGSGDAAGGGEGARMSRRSRSGFALLAVLWLVVILSGAALLALSDARLALWAARNRMGLTRAKWAAEGCLEVLRERWAREPGVPGGRSFQLDLGGELWCRVAVVPNGATLDVNLADSTALRTILKAVLAVRDPEPLTPVLDSLTSALLDWRDSDSVARPRGAEQEWYRSHRLPVPRNGPLADVRELLYVRGFDSTLVRNLAPYLGADPSPLDLNQAPLLVLGTLPGVTSEALSVLQFLRQDGRSLASMEDWIGTLSGPPRATLLAAYPQLQRRTTVVPQIFTARIEAGVDGSPPQWQEAAELTSAGQRLVVLRRGGESR